MRHKHRWLIGALVVAALAALAMIAPGEEGAIAQGGIIYVDADAAAGGGGTSWADAYADLQDALEAADTGHQIWVAAGTYKPTQLFIEGDPRSAAFQMENGVEIYGGFAGTEEHLADRDWEINVTVLSGDLNGDDGPDFANNGENTYHVFYHPSATALDSSAVLDGFTISGGNANDDSPNNEGGGMYNYGSSPTLTNCTFVGNSTAYAGGGLANYNASPMLSDCTFSDNSSANWGGGMYNNGSSPTLTNCTFEGNSAHFGGGMGNWESSSTLTDCTFSANSANYGGGMGNNYGSSTTLINCTFSANSATEAGGGMLNASSSPALTNCTLSGNTAPDGSGMYNDDSTPTVINSILWGDSPEEIANSDLFLSPLVTYSDVQGGHPGEGNINADPFFVDAGGGDYHLGPGSPCIDAGSNAAPNLLLYDFEGDPRILDGDGDETPTVDMGVDEAWGPPPPVIFVDAEASGTNSGTSWTDAFTTLQPALSWAVDGVEIWVAEGTYKPTWEFSEGDSRSATFQMVNGVEIYGGFDPSVGHTEWEDRDWVAHHTILSGDLNGDDEENLANNGENSYHVFYHPEGTNLDATAILDGFTITGGNANGTSLNYGGGMYNDGSSPALTNCTFQSNYGDGGGGMANHGSAPMLTNCAFVDNSGGAGGGMSNLDSSSPTLVNCNFSGDVVSNNGGGIWNDNSSPTLTNCTFSGNSAGSSGGGMHNGGSSPELSNCVFEDNSAEIGGGMYNGGDCSPMLVNCTFAGNSATDGGGMSNEGYASPTLTNCTFYANSASNSGGGMYSYYYSTPALTNSILWEDTPNEVWNENNSTPVVTYSDVQGGYPGDGNIDVYPFFVDAANGDLHLGPCSPCIDAGDDDVTGLPENDFEGDDRIIDGDGNGTATVDMGVDEVAVVGTCSRIYLPLVLRGY